MSYKIAAAWREIQTKVPKNPIGPLRRSSEAEASGFTAEGFQPNGPEGTDGAESAVLILVGEQEQMWI